MIFDFAEDNLKDSLMTTVNILNESVKQFGTDALIENDTELEENETARIMPKLFFCSKYATSELKSKHKLKGSLQHDDEVLDAAITRFLTTA